MTQTFSLGDTLVNLQVGGRASRIKLTPSFWSDCPPYERVVGTFEFRTDHDLHSDMEEMHPEAVALLFLVSGAVNLILKQSGTEQVIPINAGQAAIVPRGVWHRLIMRAPGKILFINSRIGMQSGNRAIVFDNADPVPVAVLRHCVSRALTYHLDKRTAGKRMTRRSAGRAKAARR